MPEKDKEGADVDRESLSLQQGSDKVSGNPVECWEQGLLVSPLHWARNGQSLVILLPSRWLQAPQNEHGIFWQAKVDPEGVAARGCPPNNPLAVEEHFSLERRSKQCVYLAPTPGHTLNFCIPSFSVNFTRVVSTLWCLIRYSPITSIQPSTIWTRLSDFTHSLTHYISDSLPCFQTWKSYMLKREVERIPHQHTHTHTHGVTLRGSSMRRGTDHSLYHSSFF